MPRPLWRKTWPPPATARSAAPSSTPKALTWAPCRAASGARFGQYVGVEGELAAGVSDDSTSFAGTRANVDLNYQAGVYAVGYLPVSPKADIFARVGYSKSEFDVSIPGASGSGDVDGVAYGVGGQYFFTDKDGIRVDVTRHDSDDGKADVVGIGYVRKF